MTSVQREYNDQAELWKYIKRWCSHLFTDDERAGPSNSQIQKLVPEATLKDIENVRAGLHDDKSETRPVVIALMDVLDSAMQKAIDRVLEEHASVDLIKRCSKCRCIVASPLAMQCLWCGHDWHTSDGVESNTPNPSRAT